MVRALYHGACRKSALCSPSPVSPTLSRRPRHAATEGRSPEGTPLPRGPATLDSASLLLRPGADQPRQVVGFIRPATHPVPRRSFSAIPSAPSSRAEPCLPRSRTHPYGRAEASGKAREQRSNRRFSKKPVIATFGGRPTTPSLTCVYLRDTRTVRVITPSPRSIRSR